MKTIDVIELYRERKKETGCENTYTELPSLTVSDEEMLVVIGQWLGEIPINKESKNKEHNSYLTPSYLLKKKIVTQKDLDIVTKRFADILKMVGISEDNICFLDNFKRNELKELTFDCYIYNTGEVISIKLNFMTYVNPSELIIRRNGVATEYEHWYCKYPEVDRLGLQAHSKQIDENKKIFYYTSHHDYHIEITDSDNCLNIDIRYPDTYQSTDIENPFVDYLKFEELLKQVTFPIQYDLLEEQVKKCLKMETRKYDITFESCYNGEITTYNFPDGVKILPDDKKLAIKLGDWLEASHAYYVLAQESTLKARAKILTAKRMNEIRNHFTEILKLTGLEISSTCFLTNYNSEDFSFDCILANGDVAHITLKMETEEHFSYTITVDYNGTITNYNYLPGYINEDSSRPDQLFLNYIDKEIDCCGTRFRHDLDSHTYYGKAYDSKGRVEVSLNYPDSLDDFYPENPFVDTQELEKVISMNCEFPFDICHVYSRVLECMKTDSAGFGINIKAIKYEKDKEYVTDAISCRGSYVSEFTITKRWRTITVKPNGAWSYDSLDWKVSQNINNQISYTLKDTISDESKIDKCPTPAEVYREAKEDADQVRKLAKSLVTPRKQ